MKLKITKSVFGTIRIFDKNNNEVYYEDINGYWTKRKFNKNNKIYFESSDGFWAKHKYDENNNEIYYEDSSGKIVDNREKKPKPKYKEYKNLDEAIKETKK